MDRPALAQGAAERPAAPPGVAVDDEGALRGADKDGDLIGHRMVSHGSRGLVCGRPSVPPQGCARFARSRGNMSDLDAVPYRLRHAPAHVSDPASIDPEHGPRPCPRTRDHPRRRRLRRGTDRHARRRRRPPRADRAGRRTPMTSRDGHRARPGQRSRAGRALRRSQRGRPQHRRGRDRPRRPRPRRPRDRRGREDGVGRQRADGGRLHGGGGRARPRDGLRRHGLGGYRRDHDAAAASATWSASTA